ncbi:protein huluwa-like [Sphaerodactylus townsendi]|uniref:Uncharacterized protein n=1 Tax=Sphaerodactylus townsendi TaxID=933632 RepID=A0ACB8ENW8_9SAUR|nr:protein huluwa-like [Sphaerodactylus townsendi]
MEPAELEATLRLLAGLLVPCVALLGLLAGLLLLRPPPRPPSTVPAWGPPALRRPCAAPDPPSAAAASSTCPWEERPPRAPPNSPAGSWASAGSPEGALCWQHSGAQRQLPSRRPAFSPCSHPAPFECGSSVRRGGQKRSLLSSANFTASQGPGLDSDFGASAGISLRILSSDSEESPPAPPPHPQQSGRFEWDYYDPSYKQSRQLQRHLPCACSKQYWL